MKRDENSELSIYKGFYVAALLPAIALSVLSPGLGVSPSDPWSVILWSALLYIPSLAFTGFFGIIAFHLLQYFNAIRWWSSALSGYLSAQLVWLLIFGFKWSSGDLSGFIAWGTIGAASSLIVWAFWSASESAAQQLAQADRGLPSV